MTHPFPHFYPVMPDASWVKRIVPLGVKVVQLRLKQAKAPTIRQQITDCLDICHKYSAQLIVNDHWRAAIELGADYIHLGQEDLRAADLDAIKAAKLKLGISTHSEQERNIALKAEPDYIALGPIYETTLKKMIWAPQGLERLQQWRRETALPLIAIGGINIERANGVYQAGADSIAVVTDIIASKTPEQRVQQWLTHEDWLQKNNIKETNT